MVERSSVNVMRILIGLTVAVGVSAVAIAKPTASLPSNFELEGLIREPIKLHVESADGRRVMLDAFVTRPAGQGRWPVALLTHGTDGTFQQDKLELNPNRLSSAAITFARHGYAAVVVLRQGYGRSSGVTDYQGNSCATPRHHRAGKLARDDILIALRAIARQPWAAADKTVLAGLSAGGFAVLAAGATNPAGVRAVINLDGGRGATDQANAAICGKAELLAALQSYGATAQTPTLWIYAENDKSFPPRLARDMFDHYHNAGGEAEFFQAPPFNKNGHAFFASAPEEFWWPRVAQFLQKHGLPSGPIIDLHAVRLPFPRGLTGQGQSAFVEYRQERTYEKAFANNGEGAWGSAKWARTQAEAAKKAIASCQDAKDRQAATCMLYAAGDKIVTPLLSSRKVDVVAQPR